MSEIHLTPEQEAEAQEIKAKVLASVNSDIDQMCRLMASKQDHELLGKNEFDMRDIGHKIVATTIEAGVNQRAKKGVPR